MTQSNVETPPIPLIKETYDGKSDKDFVKLELCRYPTSSMSDLYDFRVSLFDNGNPEEFFWLVHNFKTTLAASGTPKTGVNIQYLHSLVLIEALYQFYLLAADVESTETLNLEYMLKGLAL